MEEGWSCLWLLLGCAENTSTACGKSVNIELDNFTLGKQAL
jgi:hypothetical protein